MFKLITLISCLMFVGTLRAEDCVVLMHGLASFPLVMKPLELAIEVQPEFRVVNQGYRSYSADIPVLAGEVVPEAVEKCDLQDDESIHFVTHSMGGLLLRAYVAENDLAPIAAVVMLAPPNHGSEVVDWVQRYWILKPVLGPAGRQLGTDADELPAQLPEPEFDVGIIAGVKKYSWVWRSRLPGDDDGKVSTESTQLAEMTDYTEVAASHSGLLFKRETIEQVISFLRYRQFDIDTLDSEAACPCYLDAQENRGLAPAFDENT